MLGSKEYATVKYSNYEAHLINMMNPNFKADALPGLQEIVNLIDVNNIDRLTSTADALELAKQVHLLILAQLKNELEKEEEEKKEEKEQEGGQGNQEEEGSQEQEEQKQEGEGDGGGAEGGGRPELSLREEQKVKDKLKEIKQMIEGDVEKKQLKNKQAQMVEVVTKSGVDVAATVNGRFECMVYRLDQRSALLDNYYNAVEAYHNLEYGTHDNYSELAREYRAAAWKAANFLPPAYKHNISSNPKKRVKIIRA
jgi:hypothetical protein